MYNFGMINKYYKQDEIFKHVMLTLQELVNRDDNALNKEIRDIHRKAFDCGHYIISRYDAVEWLADKAFDAIELVKNNESVDCSYPTDLTEPTHVVHSYFLIVSLHILCHLPMTGKHIDKDAVKGWVPFWELIKYNRISF